jgi:hypothetical protein
VHPNDPNDAAHGWNFTKIGDIEHDDRQRRRQHTIRLENAGFNGLHTGALEAAPFCTGTAAHDADDRIVYDKASGGLFFDADGNGGQRRHPVRHARQPPGEPRGTRLRRDLTTARPHQHRSSARRAARCGSPADQQAGLAGKRLSS